MKTLNAIDWIALILAIVGGINWGLIGFFDFDLVASIFGPMSVASRFVYALVGISAIYLAIVSPSFSKRTVAKPRTTRPIGQPG